MPSVGQGSNKGAIGGIRATHSTRPKSASACARLRFSTWRDRRGDDIEWRKCGYMFVAYRRQEERLR